MLIFNAKSIEDTNRLAKAIADTIIAYHNEFNEFPLQSILLHGHLGSGKTSLTRALVQSLPNGLNAEVSSPSFTLCNSYATYPEILHVDLYRCEYNMPQEIWEALDIPDSLAIIEWAEYLPNAALPENFLDIFFKICEQSRTITLKAQGSRAEIFLQHLAGNVVII